MPSAVGPPISGVFAKRSRDDPVFRARLLDLETTFMRSAPYAILVKMRRRFARGRA